LPAPTTPTQSRLAASTGAHRRQLLGLRWAAIDIRHATIGFARAYVEGPTGPVLRTTETRHTGRVAIDDTTIRQLTERRRRAEARAAANELVLADSAFVFSADREGSTPWLRNRVTKTFSATRATPASAGSGSTTCGVTARCRDHEGAGTARRIVADHQLWRRARRSSSARRSRARRRIRSASAAGTTESLAVSLSVRSKRLIRSAVGSAAHRER
jgi:hypothetical protein